MFDSIQRSVHYFDPKSYKPISQLDSGQLYLAENIDSYIYISQWQTVHIRPGPSHTHTQTEAGDALCVKLV